MFNILCTLIIIEYIVKLTKLRIHRITIQGDINGSSFNVFCRWMRSYVYLIPINFCQSLHRRYVK